MYKLIRHILFWFDAEAVHHFSMRFLKSITSIKLFAGLFRKVYSGKEGNDPVEVFGLHFKNRIGLAAGFDKNAKYLHQLALLGFGHVEIGTVTPVAQEGNPRPRLFRLVKDKALLNRMGFNNAGVDAVAGSLKHFRQYNKEHLIIGGNIGKNKITPNEDAWKDYEICFATLHPWVDYFVVNVSSPNTPGLRELQEKESLKKILVSLQNLNNNFAIQRPILLKIAPDLTHTQVDEVVDLSMEISLSGLVVSNTTISRSGLKTETDVVEKIGQGGLSGKPVFDISTDLLQYIYKRSAGKLPVIASGGIFAAEDAVQKLKSGATLVQVWTGFIYEGPGITKRISKGIKKSFDGSIIYG